MPFGKIIEAPPFAHIRERRLFMSEYEIEDILCAELPFADQTIALDFVRYLHKARMNCIRDNGYWKDKQYYRTRFYQGYVCFLSIRDPDETENRWTVWSDHMDSNCLKEFPMDEQLKEIAWKHVDFCASCGSCGGGKSEAIFGRRFKNVCQCTFRFDNPDADDLRFMKMMVDMRKKELLKKSPI